MGSTGSDASRRQLFGTDGVRGPTLARGGVPPLLTVDLALALGRAATGMAQSERPRVLVIRDTRESGEMLQSALAAGIAAAGGEALLGGVLPTPAAPLLIGRYGFDLGAVISASHNPYADNGIKFFGADGFKLSDETEAAIEAALDDPAATIAAGRVRPLHGTLEDYLRELHVRFRHLDLSGVDVVLDCGNGATYEAAPEIFRRLGANPTVVSADPDGRNINAGCGSTHLGLVQETVRRGGHALGFAFDGDGDRVLAVDRNGAIVDGDELLALAARHLRAADRLPGDGVAVTVMTNYGFHTAMEEAGIAVATTAVGDRYVLEALRARGWTLGGEQSGHIIDMGFNATGDGIASALLTLEALGGRDLAERDAMRKLPQRLVNVKVAEKGALGRAEAVQAAIEAEDRALQGRGRVLVRESGTEPLVRVMVEAPSDQEADDVCGRLVEVVEATLAGRAGTGTSPSPAENLL